MQVTFGQKKQMDWLSGEHLGRIIATRIVREILDSTPHKSVFLEMEI